MDYFRKTKDRLMQTVGLQSAIPDDSELAQAQHRLKLLYTTVQSQRSSMIQYARSMCMVGEAARKLSDDISRFYSKSQQHQQTVGAFVDASLDQESNALLLFKEQFSDDIEHHFDEWLFEIKDFNDRCKHLNEQHQQIGELKLKIEYGQKNPSSYQSDQGLAAHEGLKHDMQVCVVNEKTFVQDKAAIVTTVNAMLSQRYERFDIVFIRLMEFQKDFFADGLEVTENYTPLVQQYREKNKIQGGSSSSQQSHSQSQTKSQHQFKPTQSPSQAQAQARPEHPTPQQQPQQPQQAPKSTAEPSQPPSQPPSQQQQQQNQPSLQPKSQPQPQPQPKEINLFDLDFGASPATTPSTNKKGMFDILGTSASPSPAPSTASTPQSKPQPQTQDLFGDIFSSSLATQNKQQQSTQPARQTQPTQQSQQSPSSLEDFFAGPSPSSAKRPLQTNSNSTDGFDSFLASNRKLGSQGVDDIDDDAAAPKPTAKKSNDDLLGGFTFSSTSSSSSSSTHKGFGQSNDFDFDPLSSSASSKPAPPPKSAYVPEPEQPQGPQLTESEEKEQITNHKLALEQRIDQWRYKHGVERDIQGLLSTLHSVLWTGHTWKKVDSTGLLDYSSVKKVFRRALLTVHPDKVSTGTPEMKATADLVFEILNNAFKRYEVAQGLRSA